MVERDDEFKLLGFLASLAGLLGIVVSVSQFQTGLGNSKIVTAYFSILLVVFLFVSALTFLAALQGRDVTQLNMAVLGYFSGLLAVVVALAVATLSEKLLPVLANRSIARGPVLPGLTPITQEPQMDLSKTIELREETRLLEIGGVLAAKQSS